MHDIGRAAQSEPPMSDNHQDHPEYRNLLAAVRATPADDLPRLVLADWLEEHGDREWAEFIRVQCEEVARPEYTQAAELRGLRWPAHLTPPFKTPDSAPAPVPPGRGILRRVRPTRVRIDFPHELLDWESTAPLLRSDHLVRDVWPVPSRPQLSDFPEPNWPPPREAPLTGTHLFRRGFLHAVRCRLAEWLRHGPLLVRRQPLVRIELADRECGEGNSWHSFVGVNDARSGMGSDWLPWGLAAYLGESSTSRAAASGLSGSWWYYPTPADANDALSSAALAWAAAAADV